MKFSATLSTADMITALRKVCFAIEQRNTIPILSYVRLVHVPSEGLKLFGTNLDMEIEATVAQAIGVGDICLPAKPLLGLLRSVSHVKEVEISTTKDDRIKIVADRAVCVMFPLPSIDFPTFNSGISKHAIDLPAGALNWLISGVSHSVSKEETRYYLNGCCFEIEEGDTLRSTATDGHRLSTVTQKLAVKCDANNRMILPRGTFPALLDIVGKDQCVMRICAVGKDDTDLAQIRFDVDGFTIRTKLIDGKYPDWRRVVPTHDINKAVATMSTADLLRTIKPMLAISSERGRATRLSLADGAMSLVSNNPDTGEATSSFDCDYDAAPFTIGFNTAYLQTLALALSKSGSDKISMRFNDAGSPTLIEGSDPRHGTHVIMPMRV